MLLDHQIPPQGDWLCWALLGGRGAGKTHGAGAFCTASNRAGKSVLLLGPSLNHVRLTMLPRFDGSATCAAPENIETVRGIQFDVTWLDEPASCDPTKLGELINTALSAARHGRLVISQFDGDGWPRALDAIINSASTIISRATAPNPNLSPEYLMRLKHGAEVG